MHLRRCVVGSRSTTNNLSGTQQWSGGDVGSDRDSDDYGEHDEPGSAPAQPPAGAPPQEHADDRDRDLKA